MGRSVGTAAERALELEEELELTLGEPPGWFEGESAFPSEADRRAAYEAHRDKLGGWGGRIPGHRCRGFWEYETDLPEPLEGEEALFYLAEHGLLDRGELDMVATTSANAKARIGTVAEVDADAQTATLSERVTKALR